MASRIRLYDRTGRIVYELPNPSFREWVLNDIGKAEFLAKAEGIETYIETGNYVTIEHDKLDAWVGLINTQRPWSPRVVSINAKSIMSLFGLRVGSYEQNVYGSWGAILSQMIGIVNQAEPTLLQIGDYEDGVQYSSVVDMSNLYTYLQRALVQSQTRIHFRPVVTNGRLAVYVDMRPSLYSFCPLKLEEGVNIKNSSPVLTEQGDIYNDITVIGVGLEQEKLTAHAESEASIAKYGRRQALFTEGQSQTDVDLFAQARLAQYAFPRKTLAVSVSDTDDSFSYLRDGNAAATELKTVGYTNGELGFRGTSYIRTVQFNDEVQEAVLVCQEITENG